MHIQELIPTAIALIHAAEQAVGPLSYGERRDLLTEHTDWMPSECAIVALELRATEYAR